MTSAMTFSSLDAKNPRQIRRELRNLFEGCIPFEEAVEMVGVSLHHPLRETLANEWASWGN